MPADRTAFSPLASLRMAPWAAIAGACALAACKGSTAGGIAALGPDPLVEKSDIATVGWSIDPGDHVGVAFDGHDGKPLGKKVTGTLVYKTPSGSVKTVPLVPDSSGDKLVATGPKLEPGLTEMDYTLDVDGRPLAGTLYVPPGGTPAIVAESKVRPPDAPAVEGKRGPHGGVIQLVGPDRLEIASTRSGEVRVYTLDSDLHPIVIGPRRVVLGVVADRPEVVNLEVEPSGRFLVGHWHVHGDPVRITVNETIGPEAYVAIVGYHPGAMIAVGPLAPAIGVVVVDRWDDEVRFGIRGLRVMGPEVRLIGPEFVVPEDDDHDHGRRGWRGKEDGDHDRGREDRRVKVDERGGVRIRVK